MIPLDLTISRSQLSEARVDHMQPSTFTGVLPAAVGEPIVVKGISTTTPDSMAGLAVQQGAQVDHLSQVPRYYSEAAFGRPRQRSNGDQIAGRATHYTDLDELRDAWKTCFLLGDELRQLLPSVHELVRQAEIDDLDKLTMQQGHPPGFYIESLLDERAPSSVPADYVETVNRVAALLYSRAGPKARLSHLQAVALDTSPVDTSPGAPAALGGPRARACRILTAAGMPQWKDDAQQYLSDCFRRDQELNLPQGGVIGCLITKRTGPTRRPTKLFELTATGYQAHYEATGMYCRSRLVYMVPDHINRVLLPIGIGLKAAAHNTLGLYHGPKEEQDALAVMESNGGRVWEADFSAMDRTFGPAARLAIIDALTAAGWASQPLMFLRALEEVQPIMYPSWMGPRQGVTALTGPHGLLSGLLVTSVFDTIHNLGCTLTALGRQLGAPKIWSLFEQGRLGLRVQGDDTSLALPKDLDARFDPDQYVKDMAEFGGFVEMKEGLVFLKKVQPLGPMKGKKPFNLISRVLQNTFFNEHPSQTRELARVGWAARTENIGSHPLWEAMRPSVYKGVSKLRFAREAGPDPLPEDAAKIQAFAASAEGGAYLLDLFDAISYRPTSLRELQALANMGLDPATMAQDYFKQAALTRELIMRALMSPATGEDVRRLRHMVWERELPQ